MQEDQMTQIPLWVVASLGKQIVLTDDFAGPCKTYRAGHIGQLVSIEIYSENYSGNPYVTVALDPEDESYLENFKISEIEPISDRVRFSLNLEEGLIAF